MPVGTALHARTLPLCQTLNIREWSGYYAVSAYETRFEHEYNAIRHGVALIDVSPLYKYLISGPDAEAFVDRVITRDARRLAVGQVYYTPWCDERGKVVDDGTVARVSEHQFRWTAADPSLRWLRSNAAGLSVNIEDVSERVAAIAVQGPTAAALLMAVADVEVRGLKYFRMASGSMAGVPVDISRTGYTGDLGYEVWMPWDEAPVVWDRLMGGGQAFGVRPVGMLALDIARVEAGLLLIDVDFHSSKKIVIESQSYSPFEMSLDRLVALDKPSFIGRRALVEERRRGIAKRIVGLEVDWQAVEHEFDAVGLPPEVPVAASRTAVPVYRHGRQIGRATTTVWSPILKKLIALATIDAPHDALGSDVEFEVTVEATRHRVPALVVRTPFFNPPRKIALP